MTTPDNYAKKRSFFPKIMFGVFFPNHVAAFVVLAFIITPPTVISAIVAGYSEWFLF